MSDGKATFELAGVPEGFTRAVTQALHSLDSLKRGVAGVSTSLATLSTGFAGLGALLGVSALVRLIEHSLALGDEIEKMSKRVGIGAEAIQELGHAAKLSGLSMEDLETGLKFLNKHIGEAQAGSEQANRLFVDLGIGARVLNGEIRDAGDAIEDIAEKIKNTASPAEQTRLALDAFGKSGTKLLPMLKEGRAGIEHLKNEAHELGLVLDRDMVKEAERAKDELERLTAVIQTNITRAVIAAGPAIRELTKLLAEAAAGWGKLFDRFIAPDGAASIDELGHRLAALKRELQDLEAARPKSGINLGLERSIAQLKAAYEALRNLAGTKQRAEAGGGAAPAGISAEQQAALDKFRATLSAVVAPNNVEKAILDIRKAADDTAKTLDPVTAAAVRAAGEATAQWLRSTLDVKKTLEEINAAAGLGEGILGKADLFTGLEDIKKLDGQIDTLRKGMRALAEEGVPASALFTQIGTSSAGIGATIQELTEKYKDQPAILEKLIAVQKRWGAGGEELRIELDTTARAVAGVQQGEAKVVDESGRVIEKVDGMRTSMVNLIDTTEGIDKIWVPKLGTAGIAVDTFVGTMGKLPPAAGTAKTSLVTLTGSADDLRGALSALSREMTILIGNAGGSLPSVVVR